MEGGGGGGGRRGVQTLLASLSTDRGGGMSLLT